MRQFILQNLLERQLLTPEEASRIEHVESAKPFSLHWELKTLLYLGVLLLNLGLGFLIYDNIDTIGHAAIIALIGAACAVCFWYALRHRQPFTLGEAESPTPYYDYVLLLGCLLFLSMEGYLQYQYQIFGTRYGLATFVPMVLFFGLAYWLDNRGVLSLGITALASWLGLTVTPQDLLAHNDFNSSTIVYTAVLLSTVFCLVPFLSERRGFKKHFSLTYLNFGVHIGLIACLSGMMALGQAVIFFPLLCLAVGYFIWYARTRGSLYFLTVAVLYGYIGVTYVLFSTIRAADFFFYLFYFIVSCAGVIVFLINYKRIIKTDAP
ncbi:MAG: DUF2157 domain-containing protein [Saprospiraceae bacterium]